MRQRGLAILPPYEDLPHIVNIFYQEYGKVGKDDCKSLSTIEGYHAGIKNFYSDNGHHSQWCDRTFTGNPCTSRDVKGYQSALSKSLQRIQLVKSSLPMRIPHMAKIKNFFRDQLELESHGNVRIMKMTRPQILMMNALLSLGFYVWFRIEELLRIKFHDLDIDCRTIETDTPYINLKIVFRKTNSSDREKVSRYQIHPAQNVDEEQFDAFTNLHTWFAYLKSQGQTLDGNSFLFRETTRHAVGNGAASKAMVDRLLKFLVDELDLLRGSPKDDDGYICQMTTHCLRRGGAQYRMFSSKSGKWDFTQISGWGGWSNSKNKDNLTKYLVDTLVARESDMSDLTSPCRRDYNYSATNSQPSQNIGVATNQPNNDAYNRILQSLQIIQSQTSNQQNVNRIPQVQVENALVAPIPLVDELPLVIRTRGRPRKEYNPNLVIWSIPRASPIENTMREWFEGMQGNTHGPLCNWPLEQKNITPLPGHISRKSYFSKRKLIANHWTLVGREVFAQRYPMNSVEACYKAIKAYERA